MWVDIYTVPTYNTDMNIYTPEGTIDLKRDTIRINTMRIFVEEEYGYRYWVWTPEEDSKEEVESSFEEKRTDSVAWGRLYFHDLKNFGGEWEQLELSENANELEEDWYFDEVLNPDNYDGMASIRYDAEDSRILWNY